MGNQKRNIIDLNLRDFVHEPRKTNEMAAEKVPNGRGDFARGIRRIEKMKQKYITLTLHSVNE